MPNEIDSLEKRRKRLQFRANHRGIKEMDIILGRFADARISMLSEDELNSFEKLLEESDRDLLQWFTGEAEFPLEQMKPMFEMVRNFIDNKTAG